MRGWGEQEDSANPNHSHGLFCTLPRFSICCPRQRYDDLDIGAESGGGQGEIDRPGPLAPRVVLYILNTLTSGPLDALRGRDGLVCSGSVTWSVPGIASAEHG